MCGILGVFEFNGGPPPESMIHALLPLLSHRGPDGNGVATAGGACFGHTRLSILGVNDTFARQPVRDGSYLLSFNGEIYNFRELARELRAQGIEASTDSDTHTLFQCLVNWGIERTLDRLDGMFGFAFYDHERQTLHLARDPMGEKPVFWGSNGRRAWFASEIKALLASGEIDAELNEARLDDYLFHGLISGSQTLFKNVHEIPPGTWLEFKTGDTAPRINTYWQPEDSMARVPANGNRGWAADEFKNLIETTVEQRCLSDVPLGVATSSGVDSIAIITSMLASNPTSSIDLFFGDNVSRDKSEHEDLSSLISYLSTSYPNADMNLHTYAPHEGPYFSKLTDVFRSYDEPVDIHCGPHYIGFSALAGESGNKVLLCGDGMDEVMFGYDRFTRSRKKLTNIHDKQTKLEELYFGGGQHSRDVVDRLKGRHGDGPAATETWSWVESRLDSFSIDELLLLYRQKFTIQSLLRRNDRLPMFHGVEMRSPFIAAHFVDAVNSMPMSDKYDDTSGENKVLLRRVLANNMPRRFSSRPKRPVPTDMEHWIRTSSTRQRFEKLINDPNGFCQTYLDGRYASQIVADHYAGTRPLDQIIWSIYGLERWYRAVKEIPTIQPDKAG